jgi:hypothetical protein
MDCVCGCGIKVPRDKTEVNLRASEVAWELLAWSKALSTADPRSPDTSETERLVDRGGGCYRRLLVILHDDEAHYDKAESDLWLDASRTRWQDRPAMTERGTFFKGPKLRLTEDDLARLDRKRPELSFGAGAEPMPGEVPDVTSQLQRLAVLRAEGVLSEDEFRSATARVHSSDRRRTRRAPGP